MRANITRFLVVFYFLTLAVSSFAQGDSSFVNRAISSLQQYSLVNPIEKIHLHLDRASYMPGDTAWFKVYTVSGPTHGLSAISGIVHVELLTKKDSIISRISLPINSGISWGDFALPILLKPGSYQVRAYTNWMRNFSPNYFFDQSITINETEIANKIQRPTPEPNVQFFPEGGALVNGLRCKVAIKALNVNGMGEDVEGTVTDNDGNEISVFSCQHLGMGVFAITPRAGKTYKVKITRKNGRQFTVKLPAAGDDGFAININNSQPDSISVRVAASATTADAKKGAVYYLIAQSGTTVYYAANFKLSAQSFTASIAKKRFPEGIAQFTLFAANGDPLNERIAFIRNSHQLNINLETSKENYTAREKVNISIKASNKANKPAMASLSIAVINQDLADLSNTSVNSIFSSLLLTSDISGYIENPDYYFTNFTDKTNADLDLLMLTQGYHRFEWRQVLNNKKTAITFEPENSLSISGFIKNNGDKPVPNGKLMLYSTKRGWFKLDTVANEHGRFIFKGLIPDPDTTLKYVIQARTATDKKNVIITLDTIAPVKSFKNMDAYGAQLSDTIGTAKLTPYQLQVKQQLKTRLDRRIIPLKEVRIKETRYHMYQSRIADQVVSDFPKEGTGETISQFLAVRLKQILFMDGLPYTLRAIANSAAGAAPPPMIIMLDGLPIDKTIFSMLLLPNIESAEVYGGMLQLISRKYTGTIKPVTPDVITFSSIGLYKAREFYSPGYEKVNESASAPDLRTTIFWKPDIITDKDGSAVITFNNADTKGTYRITIEGIDADGNIGRQVYTYRVQ